MKHLVPIVLISISTACMLSCKKEDVSLNESSAALERHDPHHGKMVPQMITLRDAVSQELISNEIFTYKGNRLVNDTFAFVRYMGMLDTSYSEYEYTRNQVTCTLYFGPGHGLAGINVYNYDNNRISSMSKAGSFGSDFKYFYYTRGLLDSVRIELMRVGSPTHDYTMAIFGLHGNSVRSISLATYRGDFPSGELVRNTGIAYLYQGPFQVAELSSPSGSITYKKLDPRILNPYVNMDKPELLNHVQFDPVSYVGEFAGITGIRNPFLQSDHFTDEVSNESGETMNSKTTYAVTRSNVAGLPTECVITNINGTKQIATITYKRIAAWEE
jgi:hypothetical protein